METLHTQKNFYTPNGRQGNYSSVAVMETTKYYKGKNKIENYSTDFIEKVAKSLKSEFIYSKVMDMHGINYQGIDIYFFDTLIAVTDQQNTEKVYSSMSDIEHQIDFLKSSIFQQQQKTQPRRQILGVPLTQEQQQQYGNGEAIYLENMQKKNGERFNSYVYKDENGRLKFSKIDPKEYERRSQQQPMTASYGGVKLTPTQQLNFRDGKTIFLQGAKNRIDNIERDIFLTKLPNGDLSIVEKKPRIDIRKIKEISIRGYLSEHGYEPQDIKGKNLWYCSPLRDEKTPSFKVDSERNTFKDFGGEGQGGSIIDLAMCLYGTDFKGTITALSEQVGLPVATQDFFTLKKEIEQPQKKITITKVSTLKNKALLDYLQERGINRDVAGVFCREVRYKIEGNDREFYAVGFMNDSDGWELRNKYFKGCTGKDIRTIKFNKLQKLDNSCNVFEGWTDALSHFSVFFEQKNTKHYNDDIIVLNSTSLLNDKNVSLIQKLTAYDKINAYFDNDTAGKQITEKLAKICKEKNIAFTDKSSLYSGFNDYNECRVANQKKTQPKKGIRKI